MDANAQPKGKWPTYAILLATVAAILWFSLDQPGGPVGEATGIVQAAGSTPSGDLGPSTKLAHVRLSDGTLIQARITARVDPLPGQVAKLQVYRRIFSNAQTYQLVGVESKK